MIHKLLLQILTDLDQNNIKFNFHLASDITEENGGRFLGQFDEGILAISLALKDPEWFLTLVHEYCHFLQFKDNEFVGDVADTISLFDEWLYEKLDLEPEALEESTRLVQLMELDCERRVVELLKKFKVKIDFDDYIRMANAYVLSYELVRREKRDIEKGFMSKVKHLCPTKFIEVLDVLPDGYVEIAREHGMRDCG